MEPQIQYATTADGVSIAYYAMGAGYPLVVTSTVLWSHLRLQPFREYHRSRSGQGLGRDLQVVRYDARGTGLSDRHSLDFSIDARILDLEAVVERLNLTRFALLGPWHGTPAAIAYTAGHPERVSHLILNMAYVRGRDQRAALGWGQLDSIDEQWGRYTITMASANVNFSDSESAQKLDVLYRESMTAESVRAFYTSLEAVDLSALVPRVAVPTLVMCRPGVGNSGRLEWSREVASKIPNARFAIVTAVGNNRWTDEETRIVEDFLGVSQDAPAPPSAPDALPSHDRATSTFRTILFTDIVGHTEMMQRLGDARGRDVLRDHERITREALKHYDGNEVKTDGDSFMATFASASDAVECAISMQREFARHSGSADEPIAVRMGLNVGEPIEEDGDFFGSAVILGARIQALAEGGEILVPEALRHLLAGKSFTFSDRGEFALKGFDDAVRLYEVRWQE